MKKPRFFLTQLYSFGFEGSRRMGSREGFLSLGCRPKIAAVSSEVSGWYGSDMATFKNWRAVFSRVKSALMHRGCTSDDADDLTQEAYLKLICYELKHTVMKPDAFLMRTALNLAIDAHRAQRHRGERVMLDEMTEEELARADPAPTAEARLLAKERLSRVGDSLVGLSAETCKIYLAHRLDGMTYQEIAQCHGLSVSTVEKRIAQATMAVMQWKEGW